MKSYTTREAARILEATESQVRTYARLGDIRPRGDDRFTFQELLLLRTTRGLLEAGVPAQKVRRVWSSLRRQVPDDVPLTSISVVPDGPGTVASDGEARWRPESGQFLLDLTPETEALHEEDALPEPGLRLVPRAGTVHAVETRGHAVAEIRVPPAPRRDRAADDADVDDTDDDPDLNAEQWFLLACELEDDAPEEARRAYRRALEVDPDFADAHINLGWLAHEEGELGKAEVHYREAVRSAPDDPTAHYNLGVLLEDRRRPDEAVYAYQQALARDPDCADAHFNLGLLLETLRRRDEAMQHLMTARQLYGAARGGR